MSQQALSQDLTFFTTILLSILFLLLLYKWSRTNHKNPSSVKNPPASPRSIPIIGNLHQLGLRPHLALRDLSRRHGPDLMLLRLGSAPVVVVSSAAAAREIMMTHDATFSDRPRSVSTEKLLYGCRDVASAPYGEYWRQMKSVCVLNLLSNKRVRSFRRVREEETALMLEKIRRSDAEKVNLSELFAGLANDVVCRVALGRKYSDGQRGKKFKEILCEFMELLGSFDVGDYIPVLSWLSRVNGLTTRMDKVAKELDQFLEQVVEEHTQQQNVDSHFGNEEDHKNFVDLLLWIQRENLLGFPIDRTCIKALILDMFAAGTDTTYTALEWAMTELLRHPNAMKKLQDEVRTIFGDKTGHVAEDDLDKMPYLKAVLKETLRLHPPIPLLVPRVSTRDAKIMGYDVDSGSQVFINAWAIGRDPAMWGHDGPPEEFRPERFLGSAVDYRGHDFELIPFGAGRRGCPGIRFAMAVNEIALANVIHKFDWSLPSSGDLDMSETIGLTSHRKIPLMALPKLVSY